jgi:hypothetical protein
MVFLVLSHEWPPVTQKTVASLKGWRRGAILGSIRLIMCDARLSSSKLRKTTGGDLGERDGREFVRLAKDQGYRGEILIVTAGVKRGAAADLPY